ncbi:MAG: hypothetical protein Fues2KO_06340 [Fuerstiella sp.]
MGGSRHVFFPEPFPAFIGDQGNELRIPLGVGALGYAGLLQMLAGIMIAGFHFAGWPDRIFGWAAQPQEA